MFMKKVGLMAATAMALVAASSADATVLIQGQIIWGAGTPVTTESAPASLIQFEFKTADVVANFANVAFFDFKYTVNGSTVVVPVTGITYYAQANSGLFDIFFADGNTVSLFGITYPQSDFTLGYPAPFGAQANAGVNGVGGTAGTATFAAVQLTLLPAVPEPATWGMMVAGLGIAGMAMRRRATKVSFA